MAKLSDGVLAAVLSYNDVNEIMSVNAVCRDWVICGSRTQAWKALGDWFEVGMPVSLGPQSAGTRRQGKRVLR